MKQYWLMKTEPEEYGIDDLEREHVGAWTGIRNYQVRNWLRDKFQIGDRVLVYHSSTKVPGVSGEAEVVKSAYPDPTQFDKKSDYYDARSKVEDPRWLAVDVKFIKKYSTVIPLEDIKKMETLKNSPLLQRGNRLSVIPLTKVQYLALVSFAKSK